MSTAMARLIAIRKERSMLIAGVAATAEKTAQALLDEFLPIIAEECDCECQVKNPKIAVSDLNDGSITVILRDVLVNGQAVSEHHHVGSKISRMLGSGMDLRLQIRTHVQMVMTPSPRGSGINRI